MEMLMFVIRDNKASSFSPRPFFEKNRVDAIRGLTAAVNYHDGQIKDFPSDFDMYQLGSFDPQTGKVKLSEQPEFIIGASSCVVTKEKNKEDS